MLIGILQDDPDLCDHLSLADESRTSAESFYLVAKTDVQGRCHHPLSSRTRRAQIHCYGIRRLPSRLPSSPSDSSPEGLWYCLKYLCSNMCGDRITCLPDTKGLAVAVQMCLMNPDTGRYRKRGTDGSDHVQGIRKLRF